MEAKFSGTFAVQPCVMPYLTYDARKAKPASSRAQNPVRQFARNIKGLQQYEDISSCQLCCSTPCRTMTMRELCGTHPGENVNRGCWPFYSNNRNNQLNTARRGIMNHFRDQRCIKNRCFSTLCLVIRRILCGRQHG